MRIPLLPKFILAAAIATSGFLPATQAAATSMTSLGGTFTSDDQIAWFDFTLQEDMLFTARTTSFGAGGFAPLLSLFALDAGQSWLGSAQGSNGDCSLPGAGQPSGGLCWDAVFSSAIGAGQYRLVLSQEGNAPNGLSLADGYSQTGNAHFTGIAYLNDETAMFVNPDHARRSGIYALETNLPQPIPAPPTVGLMLIGLAVLVARAGQKYTSRIGK